MSAASHLRLVLILVFDEVPQQTNINITFALDFGIELGYNITAESSCGAAAGRHAYMKCGSHLNAGKA